MINLFYLVLSIQYLSFPINTIEGSTAPATSTTTAATTNKRGRPPGDTDAGTGSVDNKQTTNKKNK